MKGMNQPLANKGKVVLLLFLILVFCTTACKQGKLLDKTYEIPETGWAYTEPVFFETQVCDTSIGYDVVFSLKHKNNYGWSNAFFLITTVFPDMETRVDTLECILATQEGEWLGNKFGKFHTIGFLYKQGIHFPQAGEYRFEVQHAMREDTLQGIVACGMRISPH